MPSSHLQQAADIVRQFAETGIETMKLIVESPDPSSAMDELFARSDAVLAVYPDAAEYGGYGVVVAKECEPKSKNCVSCICCRDREHAVALMCLHGDLSGDTEKGLEGLLNAGITSDQAQAAFRETVTAAAKLQTSYVKTLAARLQLAKSVNRGATRH